MTVLRALGKPGIFVLFLLAGIAVAYLVSTTRAGATSGLVDEPDVVLPRAPAAPGEPGDAGPVSYDDADGPMLSLRTPSPDELDAALGLLAVPGSAVNPGRGGAALNGSAYPRIRPVSQFDGGSFQGANCTLAAGAMLAQLGFGIVTTPTILRTLQRDQVGGTDLNDLAEALRNGYHARLARGVIRPQTLRTLLGQGAGVVIQGLYARVPQSLSLQSSFAGPHAIYVDGYYQPPGGGEDAFFVVDPLFKRGSRYEGEWWPGSVLDRFAAGFGSTGGYIAAWALPWDGSGPPPVDPDIPDLPAQPEPGQPQPDIDQGAGAGEAGDDEPDEPDVTIDEPTGDGSETPGEQPDPSHPGQSPGISLCVLPSAPKTCPFGYPGTVGPFDAGRFPAPATGPPLTVDWVDASSPNRVLLGFQTSPAAAATISYWPATGGAVRAGRVVAADDPAVRLADLEVLAGADYRYQITASEGDRVTLGPISKVRTGPGVTTFALSAGRVDPPPVDPAPGGFGPVLELRGDVPILLAPLDRCETVRVAYAVRGVASTGVVIRAYRLAATPILPERLTRSTLQAQGPPDAGQLVLGCLEAGSYRFTIDLVGDAAGVLYSEILPADR